MPVVLMHNQDHTDYDDVVPDVIARLSRLADRAVEAGVRRDGIVAGSRHGVRQDGTAQPRDPAQAWRIPRDRAAAAGGDVEEVDDRLRARPACRRAGGGDGGDGRPIDSRRRGHRASSRRAGDGEGGAHERRGGTGMGRQPDAGRGVPCPGVEPGRPAGEHPACRRPAARGIVGAAGLAAVRDRARRIREPASVSQRGVRDVDGARPVCAVS